MPVEEIDTPCLLLDLDAFERNVAKMAKFIKENGVRHRGHAKCHKSADIAAYLVEKGGTCGICCQKVSEAEAMVSGGRARRSRLERSHLSQEDRASCGAGDPRPRAGLRR